MGFLTGGVYQTITQGSAEDNEEPFIVDSRFITFSHATPKSFCVNFNRVTDTDGSNIKNYVVEFSSSTHIFTVSHIDTSRQKTGLVSVVIKGFINNHQYNVAVRAVDSSGNSSVSGIVTYTTPDVQRIQPVSLITSNILDTSLDLKFMGGFGGVGIHTFVFTYKEFGVDEDWRPLADLDANNIDVLQFSDELLENDNSRVLNVKGLKEKSQYLFRVDVDDEDLEVVSIYGELGIPISTYFLASIFSVSLPFNNSSYFSSIYSDNSKSKFFNNGNLVLESDRINFFQNNYPLGEYKVLSPFGSLPYAISVGFGSKSIATSFISPLILSRLSSFVNPLLSSGSFFDVSPNNLLRSLKVSGNSVVSLDVSSPLIEIISHDKNLEITNISKNQQTHFVDKFPLLETIIYNHKTLPSISLKGKINLIHVSIINSVVSDIDPVSFSKITRFNAKVEPSFNLSNLVNLDFLSVYSNNNPLVLSLFPKLRSIIFVESISLDSSGSFSCRNFQFNNTSFTDSDLNTFLDNLLLNGYSDGTIRFYNNATVVSSSVNGKMKRLRDDFGWSFPVYKPV